VTPALTKYIAQTEAQVCISLAGRLAERRARRCDDDHRRCQFVLSEVQRLAAHEAGHCVVGAALGWDCDEISIVPEPEIAVGPGAGHLAGFASIYPVAPAETERADHRRKRVRLESDSRRVAQLALQLAIAEPEFGWRSALRIIRRLRLRTETLIEANWRQIAYLAGELESRKQMGAEQIKNCLRSAVVVWPHQINHERGKYA
jgi:hypothetical protein